MHGTMMNVPLTIERIFERAERVTPDLEIVSRRPDKSLHRTTYGAVAKRARTLARALIGAGIQRGDRVATLMWNHSEHLEAYLGIPLAGAVLHTLNLRLHPDEICFIATDAQDKILIIDDVLFPLFEKFSAKAPFQKVIVVGQNLPPSIASYESFLSGALKEVAMPELKEEDALGMCYTSGTTGKPKGVVYTHKSTVLHSIVSALPDSLGLSRADTLLPVVPMFHVNAWGLPYTATMVGAKQVHPGPHLDAESLLDLMEREKVTIGAGVPTIWMGIRQVLEATPDRFKLQKPVRMVVGGAAAPEQLIRDFDKHGLEILHAWGMTETSPIGLVSRVPPEMAGASYEEKLKVRAKQGVPPPFVDLRVRNEQGDVPADGKTSGEVLVRGPWITGRYATLNDPSRWTHDGYFRTGDVANIDARGIVQLTDRIADLIKSGGEWIASVELENTLMGHPAVAEAAVVGVPHEKWGERPIGVVVLKPGKTATPAELNAFLAPKFVKYSLPDAYEFVDTIPRTSAGKFKKTELRERYKSYQWKKD
ncbi:MAG: long-chain fatty acid--CoA ligase [Myxococcota bacterium]